MKRKLIKSVAFTLILAVAILATWRITILTLSVSITDDSAYITSFGQTDNYDYTYDNDNPFNDIH